MADPIITQEDLENRLSSTTLRRIYDDNRDGAADTDPLLQLRKDASSFVRDHIGTVIDLDALEAAPEDTKESVVRLTLDAAHAFAAMRFPEIARVDGHKLIEFVEKQLKKLREGVNNLGTTASPPGQAANQGGEVLDVDPLDDTPKPHVFIGGMGDY